MRPACLSWLLGFALVAIGVEASAADPPAEPPEERPRVVLAALSGVGTELAIRGLLEVRIVEGLYLGGSYGGGVNPSDADDLAYHAVGFHAAYAFQLGEVFALTPSLGVLVPIDVARFGDRDSGDLIDYAPVAPVVGIRAAWYPSVFMIGFQASLAAQGITEGKCFGNNGVCGDASELSGPPNDSIALNVQFGGILGLAF
jgi:hypothetical protein